MLLCYKCLYNCDDVLSRIKCSNNRILKRILKIVKIPLNPEKNNRQNLKIEVINR